MLARLAQIAFWTAADVERFEEAAPLMQELAGTVARDASTRVLLAQLYAYLLQVLKDLDRETVYAKVLEIGGPEGDNDMMTIAEALRAEGGAEASVKTARRIMEKVLAVRKVPLSEGARARILECTDPEEMERWCERAAIAENEADNFGV